MFLRLKFGKYLVPRLSYKLRQQDGYQAPCTKHSSVLSPLDLNSDISTMYIGIISTIQRHHLVHKWPGGMRSPRILPKVKNSNLTFKTPAKRHEWKLFNEKSIPAHWKIMPEKGSRKNFREVGIHNIAFAQGKKKSDCLTKKCNFKIKPFLPLGIGHRTLKSHLHLTIRCPEIHPSTYETLSGWVQKSVRRHHQTSDASQDKEKKLENRPIDALVYLHTVLLSYLR